VTRPKRKESKRKKLEEKTTETFKKTGTGSGTLSHHKEEAKSRKIRGMPPRRQEKKKRSQRVGGQPQENIAPKDLKKRRLRGEGTEEVRPGEKKDTEKGWRRG